MGNYFGYDDADPDALSKLTSKLRQTMGIDDSSGDDSEKVFGGGSVSPQESGTQSKSDIPAPKGAAQTPVYSPDEAVKTVLNAETPGSTKRDQILDMVMNKASASSNQDQSAADRRKQIIQAALNSTPKLQDSVTDDPVAMAALGALPALIGGVVGGWRGAGGGGKVGNEAVTNAYNRDLQQRMLAAKAKQDLAKEILGKELDLENKKETIPMENEGKMWTALGTGAIMSGGKLDAAKIAAAGSAVKQASNQNFQNDQRNATQDFKAGQADLDRTLKTSEGDKNRATKESVADKMGAIRKASLDLRKKSLDMRGDDQANKAAQSIDQDPIIKDLSQRKYQMSIDRHTLENSPQITSQMAAELETGIASALAGAKGASVHGTQMQEMNTLQRDAANLKQYLTANPQDAVSPAIRQQYVGLLDRLDGAYGNVLDARSKQLKTGRGYPHNPQAQSALDTKVNSYSAPSGGSQGAVKQVDPSKMSRDEKIKFLQGQ